jgi:magnesium transporter
MIQKEFSLNGLRWIQIHEPDETIGDVLKAAHVFHPLVLQSVTAPTLHPLVKEYEDHIFLILHFPVIYSNWQVNEIIEVDFLITKKALITITYKHSKHLEEIFRMLQENPELQQQFAKEHTGFLLYHIIDRMFDQVVCDLDIMEEEITLLEGEIFKKRDRRIVEEIADTRRDILDIRRPMKPQSAVLKSLVEKGEKFYGKAIAPYFLDLLTTEDRIANIIENQKETIEALNLTNESLVSSHVSNVVALLTVFSAIILPLNFIASLWGMNHRFLPFRDGAYDFWIILFIMATIAGVLIYYFRKREWI